MKGILPITIAILGLIATSTILIGLTLPVFVLKYHLNINLKQEYDYNNAQLASLILISSKYNETYSMYRVISERDLNGFDENMKNKIEDVVKNLLESNCFRITNQTGIILETQSCNPTKTTGEIYIFKPYNERELIEKLILVYG